MDHPYPRPTRPLRLAPIVLLCGLVGCGPASPAPPKVDPPAAAAEAMRAYDRNSDGRLSADELDASPALKSSRERFDNDGDGQISAAELQTRLQELYAQSVSFVEVQCVMTRGGRPLSSAEVRFVPEPFLGESLQVATAETDLNGLAQPGIAADHLPENLKNVKLMQVGLYRVEVKHPSITGDDVQPSGCEIDPSRRGGTTVNIKL